MKNNFFEKIKKIKGTTLACILMVIAFAIFAKGFLTFYSLSVILKNTSILVVAASGMTMAIILGKIDVSVGATMSLSAVITGLLITNGASILVGILGGLLTGLLIGLFNGICIAVLKFDFWLVTFASLGIARGVGIGLTNGTTLAKLNENFEKLGNGTFLGIYYITWIALIVVFVIFFITKKTKYGYDLYAVGDSCSSAEISGINSVSVNVKTYVFSGLLAGIAGILLASKSNASNPIIGDPYTFDTIAAAIIGGTPFAGGKGGTTGTILGAFLLTSLKHGLALFGLSPLYQMAIVGFFIMAIIIADVMKENSVDKQEKRRLFN